MRWSPVFLMLAVSLALPPGALRAQVVTGDITQHCVTGSLTACLWTQVTTERIGDQTHARIYVRNIDDALGYGYRITGIGLTEPDLEGVTGPTITVEDGALAVNDPASHWNDDLTGTGNSTLYFETASTNGFGGIEGCHPSNALGGGNDSYFQTCVGGSNAGWVVFSFTTTNDWSAVDASIAFKVQSIDGTDESLSCPNDDLSCTTEVVPEPLTMALLGTGLAGLGGAAVRRRRRREEEEAL